MRIQHNIAAMNSYRNYGNNVSAVNKNLEKLSSGYKINRAGDDAAGLAISEKMRAQITGLNAAQKNVKDGISLVKTAEGAMQEIQDMLNRMKYIATQSANGTYQDQVDRDNLQKELDSLRTEIDRIADSANFNGINLLDGSMSDAGRVVNPVTGKSVDMGQMGRTANLPGGRAATVTSDSTNVGTDKAITKLEYTGDLGGDIKVKAEKVEAGGAKDASATGADGLSGATFKSTDGANGNFTIKFVAGDAAAGAWDADTSTLTVTLAKDGGTSGKYDADALKNAITSLSSLGDDAPDVSKIDITGTLDANVDASSGSGELGSVTLAGGEDATPAGMKVTASIGDKTASVVLSGSNWDESGSNVAEFTAAPLAGLKITLDGAKAKDGLAEVTVGKAEAADNGNEETSGVPKDTKVEIDFSSVTKAFSKDDVVKIGDKYFKFVEGTDGGGKMARAGTGDGSSEANAIDVTIAAGADKDAAMTALVNAINAKKDDLGFEASYANDKLTLTTNKEFDSVDEFKAATKVTITSTDATLKSEVETAWNDAVDETAAAIEKKNSRTGALQLQIGDTSDGYNTMKVSIGQMNTWSMGMDFTCATQTDGTVKYTTSGNVKTIDKISINTADDAHTALDSIKNAINYVSSVRGDLGAIQNRLDHTANNLSVMAENIQDAESTIRDTDIAEEMMSYTKNNILVQSAQAMLAQANQIPQGVLQLLG